MGQRRSAAPQLQWPLRPEPRGVPVSSAVNRQAACGLAVLTVAVLSVVAVLSWQGETWLATRIGLWFGQLAAHVGAIAIIALNWRPGPYRSFRVTLSAGIGLSMVASLLDLLDLAHGAWVVSFGAAGIGLVLLAFGRSVGVEQAMQTLRSCVEAAALGLVLATVAWHWAIADAVPTELQTNLQLMLPIDGFVIALTILAWVLFKDHGMALASTGASVLVIGTLATDYITWTSGQLWPISALVSVLCWPLIIAGAAAATPGRAEPLTEHGAHAELRSLLVVPTLTLGGLSIVVYLVLVQRSADRTTVTYVVAALVLVWARELIRAGQSGSLLRRLIRESMLDPLTGLPNLRRLDRALTHLCEQPGPLVALTVDVLRFKQVNDVLGRPTGDNLLREVGRALEGLAAANQGEAYRIGADEFVIMLHRPRADQGRLVADQVGPAVSAAADLVEGMSRVPVHASCGIAHLEVTVQTAVEDLRLLVGRSAMAMHDAKVNGRTVGSFRGALAQRQQRSWEIEAILRERISERAIGALYQPIWSLSDDSLAGVEALARLQHAGESIPPSEFIPVAEGLGLIHELGAQIMHEALHGARELGLFAAGKRLSVNVSTLQLRDPDFVSSVSAALRDFEVSPELLTLEVTESVLVTRDDTAMTALTKLRDLGVKLVLDDFGTGFSSLSYLTRLPVKGLKLDKSITDDLADPKTRALAASIAGIAESLGLEVVVEGVETADQEARVLELGFDLVQGWRYGQPVDAQSLARVITDPPEHGAAVPAPRSP